MLSFDESLYIILIDHHYVIFWDSIQKMFNNDTVLTKLCSSPGHLYKQDFSTLKCIENAELDIILTISNIHPWSYELTKDSLNHLVKTAFQIKSYYIWLITIKMYGTFIVFWSVWNQQLNYSCN